jgi:hypothetical protein
LQCTSAYPTPPQAANLQVIKTYKQQFPNIQVLPHTILSSAFCIAIITLKILIIQTDEQVLQALIESILVSWNNK